MSFNIKPSFCSLITICTRKPFYILYKNNIVTKFTSSLRRLSFTPFEYIVKQREPGNQGTKEPGNQGTREPGNQGTREPREPENQVNLMFYTISFIIYDISYKIY